MVWAMSIRVIDGETDQDHCTQSYTTTHNEMAIFQQIDKKYKSKQKSNYDRCHRAHSLPDLADDTPFWIRTEDSQQRGTIISTSNEPRSYIVSTLGRLEEIDNTLYLYLHKPAYLKQIQKPNLMSFSEAQYRPGHKLVP